jgi:hypothetical protein
MPMISRAVICPCEEKREFFTTQRRPQLNKKVICDWAVWAIWIKANLHSGPPYSIGKRDFFAKSGGAVGSTKNDIVTPSATIRADNLWVNVGEGGSSALIAGVNPLLRSHFAGTCGCHTVVGRAYTARARAGEPDGTKPASFIIRNQAQWSAATSRPATYLLPRAFLRRVSDRLTH